MGLFALLLQNANAQMGNPGMPGSGGMNVGQCDPNPACNPADGNCCGQCDPNPACVGGPNAIPCCGPMDQHGGPGPDGDHPECPAGTTCGGPNDQHQGNPNQHMNQGNPNDQNNGPGPNHMSGGNSGMPPGGNAP